MATSRLWGFRRKPAVAARFAEKKAAGANGHTVDAKQPFSDGSEEFFEEFTGREDFSRMPERAAMLAGLGLALGLFLGIGAIVFWRRNKTSPRRVRLGR